MFTDHQLMFFSGTALFMAALFIFQGQRWAELEVFWRILMPMVFLFIASVIYPGNIPAAWIQILAAAILALTAISIVIDLAFSFFISIKNTFGRVKNAFSYEWVFGRRLPDFIIEICRAMELLAAQGLGGLIILERRDSLEELVKSGMRFDAQIKAEVLAALFDKNSTVHDGAVIIRRGRIAGAKAILPISTDNIPLENAGLRHRSALGIAQKTDAVAFVVSEQRREFSIAYRGNIVKAKSQKELLKLVKMALKRKAIRAI